MRRRCSWLCATLVGGAFAFAPRVAAAEAASETAVRAAYVTSAAEAPAPARPAAPRGRHVALSLSKGKGPVLTAADGAVQARLRTRSWTLAEVRPEAYRGPFAP